ncbi:MAG: zinc ribbon domain-containing protein [Gammaproteobacteria bacterium]|nr:zinc ribbon domain-containing protein [Gammaproteobacteria bacterium]
MTISKDDQKLIAKWIQEKCGQLRCTCCGHSNWQILELAALPIGIDLRTTRFYYSQGVPQINVVCTNCGYTLLFNPSVMGIEPNKPQPEEIDS